MLFLVLALAPGLVSAQSMSDLSDRFVAMRLAGEGTIGKTSVVVARTEHITEPFTGSVVRIRLAVSDSKPAVWIRLLDPDADPEASPWQPAVLLGDGSSGQVLAAFHSDTVVEEGWVEVAVAGAAADILIGEAAVFDNRADDDRQSAKWDFAAIGKGATSGLIVPPRLITRADWGASPFRGDPVPLARPSYDRITFHHAACCGAYTYEEGIAQVKGIQVFHQDGRGWSDIGYHFVLDQSGRLYQGRPFMNEGATLDETPILAQGAHVGGANTGNIGVSALGCYHPPEGAGCGDALSAAAYDSLITVLAFLSERYGIPPSEIGGHRDFSSTACPGDNNYSLLPQIRNDVALLLETGNAPVGAASLIATSDPDGVVRLDWQFLRDEGIVDYTVERESTEGSEVVFQSESVEDFSVVDASVTSAGTVAYVLRARNADGRWETLSVTEVEVVRPEGTELAQSFPNPTTARATIRYYLTEEGVVTLSLFDAVGRRVAVLTNSFQDGGRWYAVPVNLNDVAPGQYYYRLQVEGFTSQVFDQVRSISVSR